MSRFVCYLWRVLLAGFAAVAATTAVILALPHAAAQTCPASAAGPPPGATQKPIGSVSGGTDPDTLWIAVVPNPGPLGGAARLVGITSAGGAELGPVSISTASPLPLQAVVVDAAGNGEHQLIVDTGRDAQLFVISGCQIQQVVDTSGKPFLFDVGNRQGYGDGVGCSDLGDGRHFVELLPQQEGGQWIVRRTEIVLDGTIARIARSDTVAANSAQDPAVTTAYMISCGDITMATDGVMQPGY